VPSADRVLPLWMPVNESVAAFLAAQSLHHKINF